MKHPLLPLLATATLAVSTPALQAATAVGDHLQLSGFGTLGAVVTDTDQAQYRIDPRQPDGADTSASFGVDSKLGLQANVRLNDTFSAVGQVLVSHRMSDRPVVEWLYGEAALPYGFTLKLGRAVLPTFMVSDSRSVGYAAHWLRAPQEVYALYPASSLDGAFLEYRTTLGPVNLAAQFSAGQASVDMLLFGLDVTADVKQLRSLSVVAESGDWLARVGRTTMSTTPQGLPVPPLDDAFTGVGVQYDNGRMVVMAEYAQRRNNTPGLFDSNSWYVSGGWRFGAWTPYLTVARFTPVGAGYVITKKESTDAVGLRWDAMKGVALKAQLQDTRSGMLGFTGSTPAFFAEKPKVRVYSVAVDFVF